MVITVVVDCQKVCSDACHAKQVQHTQDTFLLSSFIKLNNCSGAEQSNKIGYHINPGFQTPAMSVFT